VKSLATIWSYIFHPVLIPLLATGCSYFMTREYFDTREIYITLFQVGIMTMLLPMVIYLFLRSIKAINSTVMVQETKERRAPVFLNIVLIGILVFQILSINRNIELKLFFLGYGFSYVLIFISLFFNKKYSLHMLSFSALIVFLLYAAQRFFLPFILPMCALLLILGLIGSARLKLHAHSLTEIIVGTLIGIVPQLGFHYLSYLL